MDITLHCSSCGADFNKRTLEENLELISNCTNCLADLKLNGNWTGSGFRIMTKLIEKYGIKVVKLTNEKLQFERS